MSKTTARNAKGARSSSSVSRPPAEMPSLKFAEGSSFLSLPVEEQQRLIGYLHAYRKELPRLLKEGEAGRFAVIQNDEVVHVWDTADDAMQAATLLIGPGQFAVYQVKENDVVRLACSEDSGKA